MFRATRSSGEGSSVFESHLGGLAGRTGLAGLGSVAKVMVSLLDSFRPARCQLAVSAPALDVHTCHAHTDIRYLNIRYLTICCLNMKMSCLSIWYRRIGV